MSRIIWQDLKNTVRSFRFWCAAAAVVASAMINYAINSQLFFIGGTLNVFLYSTTFGFCIFAFTAPIIAALPGSQTYGEELNSGYIKQILLRTGRSRYLAAKIVSSASSAVLATAIGLGAVFIMSLAIDSSCSYRTMPLLDGRAFKTVYDHSMLGYIGLFTANSAIFSAAYSVLALGISAVVRNKYLSMSLPAVLYIAGTLSSGLFLGLPVLPFSTFTIASVSSLALCKDHLSIGILGLSLFFYGFSKWQISAR